MSTQTATIHRRCPRDTSSRKKSSSVACVRSRPNHTGLVDSHVLEGRPTPLRCPPLQHLQPQRATVEPRAAEQRRANRRFNFAVNTTLSDSQRRIPLKTEHEI